MHSNLSQVFSIQKELESIGYPDAHRVSIEIDDFISLNSDISLNEILSRLRNSEPWEYIRGSTEFCGNKFVVNHNTLIPRIETEQLVNDVFKYIKTNSIDNIVDIGTGTGCIAISLKKLLYDYPLTSIYATDISTEALHIAKINELNILKSTYIEWINTDLIENIPPLHGNSVLIANLPYIPTQQYLKLDSSVKNYEPRLALHGGSDGLDLYKKLIQQIQQIQDKKHIFNAMFFETEESIYNQSVELIKESFPGYEIQPEKDIFKANRFVYTYLNN